MRVAVPFDIPRAEVRDRLKNRSHEIAHQIPGGVAEVETDWPSEDRMNLTVNALGQKLRGTVDIEDNQLVFQIALPMALSFIEPVVAGAIKQQGQKLLTES